ncbi:unnamed protein product [Parascedosporium putredinis]|uniref:PH domain-containing protein n=1 Tax=Parascedosporium putredinis TaxID=1442378 RepID=A0A9P1GWC1_9PEZI|nr:unnamed protein product [Parascedosporium putredinis]CAI7988693.1 unnamed protein product [Parascedosporium putredinis]
MPGSMSYNDSVQPLRVSRDSTMSSPTKMGGVPRALTEISPSEKRRNSPSWNQTSKKMNFQQDSSPFQSSPVDPTKSSTFDSSQSSEPPQTPKRENASPIKSSLSTSRFKSSFDEATGSWVPDLEPIGSRSLHRHTKSVTFDNGPPQVNEYEMATPDLSSIGSNSREGSYDSEEDDEYNPLYHPHYDGDDVEDSFDASLEDTDKTPVSGTAIAPTAADSKAETQNIGNGKMTLEERLKLMMLSDDSNATKSPTKTAAELQRERRMRRAAPRDRFGSPASEADTASQAALEAEEEDDVIGDLSGLEEYQLPPRISRESILRRVNGNRAFERESDYHFSSPAPSSPERVLPLDPDVPIPSTEEDSILEDDDNEGSVIVRRDLAEREDSYPYREMSEMSIARQVEEELVIHEDKDDDSGSHYSESAGSFDAKEQQVEYRPEDDDPTPHASPIEERIPTFEPTTESVPSPSLNGPPVYDGSGWGEPEEYEDDESATGSVIHHPVDYEDEEGYPEEVEEEEEEEEEEAPPTPEIPEQLATIKSSSGSKLRTRPSATPSDLMAMREARRQVSREIAPLVPPIPDRHLNRRSQEIDPGLSSSTDYMERHPSFKKRSLTLDLDLGLSLDQDFDRRGYLMRQNTKLVAASDKESDDSWRTRSAGHESNALGLNTVTEDDYNVDFATTDSGERGRLFIKVMGVKDLDLPISKTERTWFSLTLDNGVHCVTTAWLELARNAPIGQEFELVVPNDLEFQLTLNVKLEKPAPVPIASSPTKATKAPKTKTSTFGRMFTSPKKRREMEMRQREEEQRLAMQRDAQTRQVNAAPTVYDLLSPLVAEDGSFARSYVCLKEHESRCFGRPYLAEVACFNEWATEEAGFASSVKSKRGTTAVVRRAPYKIGKLELQLLFVPRPKGVSDEDMPKSMNSCIRELKAAEERLSRNWEGHLSQQGGDCPYWRRRYFKLVGAKLTAYHEATRQPRATINLGNARRLIDDRRTLTEKETMGKGGRRRRSAFAEEEEGYMFVEEGFRIRFNNGEVIDFYADTAEDKEGWMRVLGELVGRGDSSNVDEEGPRRNKWCELILKREESLRKRAEGRRVHSRTKSMYL